DGDLAVLRFVHCSGDCILSDRKNDIPAISFVGIYRIFRKIGDCNPIDATDLPRPRCHQEILEQMTDKIRCAWCGNDPLYQQYHDEEWGRPVYDDRKLFEFLILETFQAGLSWITILRNREAFREAFDDFDYTKVAAYNDDKIAELMNNAGIIRNGLKIKAAVS